MDDLTIDIACERHGRTTHHLSFRPYVSLCPVLLPAPGFVARLSFHLPRFAIHWMSQCPRPLLDRPTGLPSHPRLSLPSIRTDHVTALITSEFPADQLGSRVYCCATVYSNARYFTRARLRRETFFSLPRHAPKQSDQLCLVLHSRQASRDFLFGYSPRYTPD